jgi:hypothetical protein
MILMAFHDGVASIFQRTGDGIKKTNLSGNKLLFLCVSASLREAGSVFGFLGKSRRIQT